MLNNNSKERLLPYSENAVIDIRKLRDYSLNKNHKSGGKHKSRLFSSVLGMTAKDAEALKAILLDGIKNQPAQIGEADQYGQRYSVRIEVTWGNKSALVLSAWILEYDSNVPRLTTCYPL